MPTVADYSIVSAGEIKLPPSPHNVNFTAEMPNHDFPAVLMFDLRIDQPGQLVLTIKVNATQVFHFAFDDGMLRGLVRVIPSASLMDGNGNTMRFESSGNSIAHVSNVVLFYQRAV